MRRRRTPKASKPSKEPPARTIHVDPNAVVQVNPIGVGALELRIEAAAGGASFGGSIFLSPALARELSDALRVLDEFGDVRKKETA